MLLFLFSGLLVAQDGNPTDYLSKDFHKKKRDELRAKMPANSVALVFANPVRNRANDVDYIYHQDPNFYYLTGYREPNAVLVLFSEDQVNDSGESYNEILYVQERNKTAEMWNGKRLQSIKEHKANFFTRIQIPVIRSEFTFSMELRFL